MKRALLFVLCMLLMSSCSQTATSSTSLSVDNPSSSEQIYSQYIESKVDALAESSDNKIIPDEYRVDELFGLSTKRIVHCIEIGGPEYEFIFEYDDDEYEIPPNNEDILVTITIVNETSNSIQHLEYINNSASYADIIYIWFEDMNFDGYTDLRCRHTVGGNRGNASYVGWLWNQHSGQFDFIEGLSDVTNLTVDPDLQVLRSGVSTSAVSSYHAIYRFVDKKLTLTDSLSIGGRGVFSDDGPVVNYIDTEDYTFSIEARELVSGEMREVFPEVICETEEGKRIIEEYLYGSDSIWDLYKVEKTE